MKYITGESVQQGDHVLIEYRQTPGRVTNIIESEAEARLWNLEEPGLMLKSAPFGLVFWPQGSKDPVVFVRREEPAATKHDV